MNEKLRKINKMKKEKKMEKQKTTIVIWWII